MYPYMVCLLIRLYSLASFPQPINDKTNVKDQIHLRNFTYGHDDLLVLFNNQVATLGDMREADEEEEKAEGIVSIPSLSSIQLNSYSTVVLYRLLLL